MKLQDMEFKRLLPYFMQGDLAVLGLSAGLDDIIQDFDSRFQTLTTWDRINEMGDAELDELAWELNIFWYRKDIPVEVKRKLVLDSDKVYMRLGTKWAIENVIKAYFGDESGISEWFEYGGEPGRFRVHINISGQAVSEADLVEFRRLVTLVKRKSAHLDDITIATEMTTEPPIHIGAAMCGTVMETTLPPAYVDVQAILYVGAAQCGTIMQTVLPNIKEG